MYKTWYDVFPELSLIKDSDLKVKFWRYLMTL